MAEDNDDTAEKEKNKEALMLAAAFFIAVAGISVTIFSYLWSDTAGPAKKIPHPDRVQVLEIEDPDEVLSGAVLQLEPFIVNLKSNSGILYFRVSIEFYDFSVPEEVDNLVPALRDYIITRVSDRHERDLMVNGPEKIRELLLEDINTKVPEDNPVTNVFIENFLIR